MTAADKAGAAVKDAVARTGGTPSRAALICRFRRRNVPREGFLGGAQYLISGTAILGFR